MLEDENRTVDAVVSNKHTRGIFAWFIAVLTIVVLGIVGYGVFLVRSYLPVIGMIWLVLVGLLPVFIVLFGLVMLLRLLFHATNIEIGPSGTIVQRLWFTSLVHPLPLEQGHKVQIKEEKPVIPTLSELLSQRTLDGVSLLLGYRKDGTARWGTWAEVRTCILAGVSRSGKTVTMLFYIIQALMSGAVVSVCDPHYNKRSGISKILEPLFIYPSVLRIAKTDEEIVSLVEEYLDEMERRLHPELHGESQEGMRPRLLVIDEWTRLMDESILSKEDKDILTRAVKFSNEQYAGVEGYAMIAGHEWTARESGGSHIRRSILSVFVHKLDEDYAKFLLKGAKGRKAARNVPNQKVGNLTFQDSDGQVEELVIPYGTKQDVETFSRMLQEYLYPGDEVLQLPSPQIEARPSYTLPVPQIPEQIASHNYPTGNTRENRKTTGNTNGNTRENNDVKRPEPFLDVIELPVSMHGKQDIAENEGKNEDVSFDEAWKRETIHRMRKINRPFREIAFVVKMTGRKYQAFIELCNELGYDTSKEAS